VPAATLSISLDVGMFNGRFNLPPPRKYPPPGFHDTLISRLGVEWRLRDWPKLAIDLRGGYAYEPTPAPEQIDLSNFADCDKHTFSTGLGVELRRLTAILPRPIAIDLHAALTYLPPRTNHKLDPLDRVGDFVASGVVPQIGVMLRSRF
jgi:long-chain fatty acid transport protein